MIRRMFWRVAALSSLAIAAVALWQIARPLLPPTDPEELPAAVEIAGKVGYVSRSGAMVIPPVYSVATSFGSDGLARVRYEGRTDWIDAKGKVVCTFECAIAESFDSEGYARVKNDESGKWGWINRKGEVVVPLVWELTSGFDSGGMALVYRQQRFGWIDRRGNVVIPLEWTRAEGFDERGLASVSKSPGSGPLGWRTGKELWGWIDRKGRLKIPLEWESPGQFDSRGWTATKRKNKWGWIDKEGKVVLPFQWDGWSFDFDEHGFAAVWLDGKGRIIDRAGRKVAAPEFDAIDRADALGWRLFERDGVSGWFDDRWNVAIAPTWVLLRKGFDENGFAIVRDEEYFGLIDRSGRLRIQTEGGRVEKSNAGYSVRTDAHPLMKHAMVSGIVDRLGLRNSPPFDSLTVLYDRNLHAYWRSDLYALRPLLWPTAVGGLLVGAFSLWRLRRPSRAAKRAA